MFVLHCCASRSASVLDWRGKVRYPQSKSGLVVALSDQGLPLRAVWFDGVAGLEGCRDVGGLVADHFLK